MDPIWIRSDRDAKLPKWQGFWVLKTCAKFGKALSLMAQRLKNSRSPSGIVNFNRDWKFQASHPPKPIFCGEFWKSGIEHVNRDWKFQARWLFSEKEGGNSVNGGFGKDFYRKGNSVKRSGRLSELPDSENWKVDVLIPFPKIRALAPKFRGWIFAP